MHAIHLQLGPLSGWAMIALTAAIAWPQLRQYHPGRAVRRGLIQTRRNRWDLAVLTVIAWALIAAAGRIHG